jgi:hypothetical protein
LTISQLVADYGPIIGLAGVGATLWVNGSRDERRRRRANHARAIQAVVAYAEMPYRIRRRRHEPEHASSERARLSDAFSEIQADLANSEAVLRTDPDTRVRAAYSQLVAVLRATAGKLAADAWTTAPVDSDQKMGMPDVFDALEPVREQQRTCEAAMAGATRSLAKFRKAPRN